MQEDSSDEPEVGAAADFQESDGDDILAGILYQLWEDSNLEVKLDASEECTLS